MSSCRKPQRSPIALRSGGPAGGLTSCLMTVSSSPWSRNLQCVGLSASASVASSVAQIPAPVTYITRSG